MIRINLLGRQIKKPPVPLLHPSRRVPLGGTVILLLTTCGVGWWYWSLGQTAQQLTEEIAATQQQADRMKPVLAEVASFDQRKTQLQKRVAVIEELRGGQSVPVQLLDHVSRSVPDLLWLTSVDQQKGEMSIEGRAMTLIALSDFVGNLGSTTLLKRPIEIVSSQVETMAPSTPLGIPADVIKFTVKAQLTQAEEPAAKTPTPTTPGGKG